MFDNFRMESATFGAALLLIVLFLTTSEAGTTGAPAHDTAPLDVLQEYLKLEADGTWLTPEGKEKVRRLSAAPMSLNREIVTHVIASYSIVGSREIGGEIVATVLYDSIGSIEDFSNFSKSRERLTVPVTLSRFDRTWKVVTELPPFMSWRAVVSQRGPRWKDTIKAAMDAAYEAARLPPDKVAQAKSLVTQFCESDAKGNRVITPKGSEMTSVTPTLRRGPITVISGYKVGGPVADAGTIIVPVYYEVVGKYEKFKLKEDRYNEAILFELTETTEGWRINRPESLSPHVALAIVSKWNQPN